VIFLHVQRQAEHVAGQSLEGVALQTLQIRLQGNLVQILDFKSLAEKNKMLTHIMADAHTGGEITNIQDYPPEVCRPSAAAWSSRCGGTPRRHRAAQKLQSIVRSCQVNHIGIKILCGGLFFLYVECGSHPESGGSRGEASAEGGRSSWRPELSSAAGGRYDHDRPPPRRLPPT